ncbi:MAG: hypothetical protein LBU62_10160 [Bacteroidales bacterium]|nr:hypothetical protein [Bacteroidales bacterium]
MEDTDQPFTVSLDDVLAFIKQSEIDLLHKRTWISRGVIQIAGLYDGFENFPAGTSWWSISYFVLDGRTREITLDGRSGEILLDKYYGTAGIPPPW